MVSLLMSCLGWYVDLMFENMLWVFFLLMLSVSCSSLFDFLIVWYVMIFVMCRLIFVKLLIEIGVLLVLFMMVGFVFVLVLFFVFFVVLVLLVVVLVVLVCSELWFVVSSVLICFVLMCVIRCWYVLIGCVDDSGFVVLVYVSGVILKNVLIVVVMCGIIGFSVSDSRWKVLRFMLQVLCSVIVLVGFFVRFYGFVLLMYVFILFVSFIVWCSVWLYLCVLQFVVICGIVLCSFVMSG